jgi:hypothetical protein
MRTLIVIGAGANKEIGIPTGPELKSIISEQLEYKKGFLIHDLIIKNKGYVYWPGRTYSISEKNFTQMKEMLPFVESIDNYIYQLTEEIKTPLQTYPDSVSILGKIMIVLSILNAEHTVKSKGFEELKGIKETWYPLFFQKLSKECTRERLIQRLANIVFIIFNYDRCFELFLFKCLAKVYDYKLSTNELIDIFKKIKIYHPYGTIGSLPIFNSTKAIEFGNVDNITLEKLTDMASRIKTFNEKSYITSKGKRINFCRWADRIIFLGFAYHQQNMDLIYPMHNPNLPSDKNVKIYGTAYKISNIDIDVIKKDFIDRDTRHMSIDLLNNTCRELFENLSYALSFA